MVSGVVSDNRTSGGLIGDTSGGDVTNSYWNTETSGLMRSADGSGQTTEQLQTPTGNSGIYQNWATEVWDFGSRNDYPQLKYALGDDPNNPACDGRVTPFLEQPACGSAQARGLINLNLFGAVQLSPRFSSFRYNYRLNAYIGLSESVRLAARAADANNTTMTAAYNGNEIALVDRAISEPIVLDPTVDDVIVVSLINAGRVLRYVLEIDYASVDVARPAGNADSDGDGLIEINALEDLDAMRNDVNGAAYTYRLPDDTLLQINDGCPITTFTAVCRGYELTRNLDFRNPLSYHSGVVNTDWLENWQPIGDASNPFNTMFIGNGFEIRNLNIRGSDDLGGSNALGLFHTLSSNAAVERLRLRNVTIYDAAGLNDIAVVARSQGTLAGVNLGRIFDVGVSEATMLASLTSSTDPGTPVSQSRWLGRFE